MGAQEFGHVHFSIRGDLTPGGTVTVDSTGTPGLAVFLFVGSKDGKTPFPPFGTLFINLAWPWLFYPLAVLPDSSTFTIPASTPAPSEYHLQELAIHLANNAGNLSSPVRLRIE